MPSVYSMVARYGLAGLSPSQAIRASRRISPMPVRHKIARRYASVASMVLPSGRTPAGDARSAAAAQRSASAGWPRSAKIKEPCTAIAP